MTIDWWTLGFRAVNVVILVWLLQHFFWRPVAAIIEQRRSSTENTVADAKSVQDKAAADPGFNTLLARVAGWADMTERLVVEWTDV